MHRRTLLLTAAAAALPLPAAAYPAEMFTPALWRETREQDRAIIFNYRATWSLTCQIKARLIAEALDDTPAYQSLTFVDVDWDTFGQSQLTQRLKVKRRSTLLVMKRGKEIARLENEPYARRVRAFLDTALTA
ncbi:thioredoxin family protein [Tateyamaria sp. SN6-1]|uniref:thioredoxin family protein n=1 Tax=Tateyamaria sp. SN6-1 TaxID=3092148 RepID=UPI0039F5A496